ncbi:MAG: HDOD domain-containing protein [Deltaproteobacteria bacterium]|nr:HDOD domain-containing protein [Deltaproteobacteria bacterium]
MHKRIVSSGDYAVSKQDEAVLEAYLGSCVGITMCDPEAGVGGLLHLILPEPVGFDKERHPERYATTGMPLFIQSLEKAGARREHLRACVAGGALVGKLTEADLFLDIGGRTTEIVEKRLRDASIKIEQSETGGHLGCCLSLDLRNWETRIEPVGLRLKPEMKNFKKFSREDIHFILSRLRPIPQLVLKIVRMINDDAYDLGDLSADVRSDQVIAGRVLHLCNSALIGIRGKIDSIDRALTMLGQKELLRLVCSASLEGFFEPYELGYSLIKGGLYQHAVGTGTVAAQMARLLKVSSPDVAYTAGLLHDIGKVAMDQYIADAYPLFYRRMQEGNESLLLVESDTLGIDHAAMGGLMADKWGFPGRLLDVIAHHHSPEDSEDDPELAHIVYFADLLMGRFHAGRELENMETERLASRLSRIGLKPNQFPLLVVTLARSVLER